MTKSNTKGKTNPFGGRGGCKKMVLSGIFNFAVWYFQRKKSWQRWFPHRLEDVILLICLIVIISPRILEFLNIKKYFKTK